MVYKLFIQTHFLKTEENFLGWYECISVSGAHWLKKRIKAVNHIEHSFSLTQALGLSENITGNNFKKDKRDIFRRSSENYLKYI